MDNIEQTFTDQLSEFETKLREQDDNASLLKEIHAAITLLMSRTGDRDAEIREILQTRYNAGKLRLETYQLVRNVLDRVVIESMATMPDALDDDEDSWSNTTVIGALPGKEDAPQERLQVGSVLRDRFLLQERVAGGSMGVVFKALDRRIAEADGVDPWVAIKVLSPKLSKNGHALRALQQEAAKGRCLLHPNIVRFIDLDRDDEMYFIVMEWLQGRSLATILDENKDRIIDRATALDIVRQVGRALDYAHRCGVVHADVKPANIMISPSGEVKLFDFGIARIRQKQSQSRRDFDPGVLGAITPAYSSMQVLTGDDPVPADDVFSLGCLMYRLVAGHRVFGPRNAAEAAEQGMEPQRPQGLTDPEWRALKKALAFARVARFATPAEFLDALDAKERPALPVDDRIIVEPKWEAPAPRRPWGLAAIVLAVVAVAVTLVSQPELIGRAWDAGQSLFGRAQTLNPSPDERSNELAPAVAEKAAGTPGGETAPGGQAGGGMTEAVADGRTGNTAPGGVFTPQTSDHRTTDDRTGDNAENPPEGTATGTQAEEQPADTAGQAAPGSEGAAGEIPGQAPPASAGAVSPQNPPVGQVPSSGIEPAPGTDATMPSLATVTIPLTTGRLSRTEIDLTLREDSQPAVVELVRESDLVDAFSVLVEEVGFSGNRSPLTTDRYRLSNKLLHFDAGQETARFTISMPSDALREADRQATLLLRNAVNSTSHFAVINLTLEDDDERAFESGLPPDTLGFADGEVYVRERNPAVEIDVLRLNPGNTPLDVRYFISGGSATEGEDFFLPGATELLFGPGQRRARLLIPLVQDATVEGSETFTLELAMDSSVPQPGIHRQITVIMQDDDSGF